jgi:hypothetical protein
MREELAEQLLGMALDWDTPTAKEEIGKLRYLAIFKYDGYQNFEPGNRFLESLALWLRQFKSMEERRSAYRFISSRLVYISEAQMDHLVGLLYPQRIFPILSKQVAEKEGIPLYHVKKIRTTDTFAILKRKTLFLGLSDGARMDAFRRKNALNNDQVSVSYELSGPKWQRMHEELEKWINKNKYKTQATFENIFLIDDFSGSGNSILRTDKSSYTGKLKKFIDDSLGTMRSPAILGKLCIEGGPRLFTVTYLSTEAAVAHLRNHAAAFIDRSEQPNVASCEILDPLQLFENSLKVPQPSNQDDSDFDKLLDKYYDGSIEDANTKTGGKDVKHGLCRLQFASCFMPQLSQ